MIPQPKDRGILLKDILEPEVDEKYYLSDKMLNYLNRGSKSQSANRLVDKNDKTQALMACDYKGPQCVAMRGRNPENTSDRAKGCPTKQMLEAKEDSKTNCITTVQKDNLVVHNMMSRSSKSGKGGTGHLTRQDGKTYCLDTGNTNAIEKHY